MLHSPENSKLGKTTDYPKTYAPDILYPIHRELGRASLALPADQLTLGIDWWHVFELSWLNPFGISQVAMARIAIPARSKFIVESKSLKLYFNSLNFTEFADTQAIKTTIETDLSNCVQANVTVELFSVMHSQALPLSQPDGVCIDEALAKKGQKVAVVNDVANTSLAFADTGENGESTRQIYHSHLLRSNCPVTNQPDWGTVFIDIDCPMLDTAGLLQYILSFRQHNGFHEQCVEQIFSDLSVAFNPSKLLVRAWYTRRGGIDINPCRVSDLNLLPKPSRINRQ
mgnify:CR=1 FL=1